VSRVSVFWKGLFYAMMIGCKNTGGQTCP